MGMTAEGYWVSDTTEAVNNTRWVFLVSMPDDEVWHESTIEFRADSIAKTIAWRRDIETKMGCELKVIGRREGSKSSARFHPLVPIHTLPGYIRQNENVIGDRRSV
jgi:hypothetical protein